MAARIFTRALGLIFVLLGACAFVPALSGGSQPGMPADRRMMFHYETLFGQFPMNYLLAIILIGFGLVAFWESLKTRSARLYNRVLFTSSLALLFLGLCPHPVSDLFGILPLYSWTSGLFLVTALCTFYPAFFDGPMPESATQPVFPQ
jgi:hypothetical protein